MTMKALQPFKVGQVIKNAIGYLEEGERDLFLQTKNRLFFLQRKMHLLSWMII